MPDYYKVLNVPPRATLAELKTAYRRMALRHHPDSNPGDEAANRRFHLVNEAWRVLSDPERREFFDRFGLERDALTRSAPLGGVGQFAQALWGELRGRSPMAAKPGAEIRQTLSLSFLQAAQGGQHIVRVPREVDCPTCLGSGAQTKQDIETCHVCDGAGEVREAAPLLARRVTCLFCGGRGTLALASCRECSGLGRVLGALEVAVQVAPGTETGKVFRVRGCGERGQGGAPDGDLWVRVEVQPSTILRREGLDVVATVPLSVPEALLGCVVPVPTVQGVVRVRVPPMTRPGDRFRLEGRGIRQGGRVGHAVAEVVLEWPQLEQSAMLELLKYWPAGPGAEHPLRREYEDWLAINLVPVPAPANASIVDESTSGHLPSADA